MKNNKTPKQIFPNIIRNKVHTIQLKNLKTMVYLNEITCNNAKCNIT